MQARATWSSRRRPTARSATPARGSSWRPSRSTLAPCRSRPEATDPATDYKAFLRRYIDESRAIGATPILVTPMVRRTFDAQGQIVEGQPAPNRPLAAYAEAMKAVAAEKNVPVIDLYASSKAQAEKLGPVACLQLASAKSDVTHFNEKGARAMADLVIPALPVAAPALEPLLKK